MVGLPSEPLMSIQLDLTLYEFAFEIRYTNPR